MVKLLQTLSLAALALLALPFLLLALTAGMPMRERAPFALAVLAANLRKLHTKKEQVIYPRMDELQLVPVRIDRQG